VCEQAQPKGIQVQQGDAHVPEEVARGKRLHNPTAARVAPDALFVVHAAALLVRKHNPEGDAIDDQALDERDDVGVPVGFLCAVMARIVLGKQLVGEHGRDDGLDEGVEEGGADDFVDVQGQSRHREALSVRLDSLAQCRDRREGERIAHCLK
jgi:hypothetical protein